MNDIRGYKLMEKLHEGTKSLIYRACRITDNQSVILKMLNEKYPQPESFVRFRSEYELLHSLHIDGVVKVYSLETCRNSLAMVMEDCGGRSLAFHIRGGGMKLEEFLPLAERLAAILNELHGQGIMHKDLHPANIIWNPENGQVRLIDFATAATLTAEELAAQAAGLPEGTLPYISPEQTGRIKGPVDHRTDLYSLGATFYEMLLGFPPFQAADPMELVHCHLAKPPAPPHALRPGIPKPVGEIILKLMAKNAADRYQSAFGLKHDLEKCRRDYQSGGKVKHFALGRKDVSCSFHIPEKLYGREKEKAALLAGLEQAARGTANLILVCGCAGIGKSALVHELEKPVAGRRGRFIAGKADRSKRDIPYYIWLQALGEIVRQLLAENAQTIDRWKKRILAAVGDNGQVLSEVIPEMELILGKQPPVGVLAPAEAQNRFNLVFQKFIRALSPAGRPLAIFLDDLQWADPASLGLITRLIADPGVNGLLMIGAYRDDEVDDAHPLMKVVAHIGKARGSVQILKVGSLRPAATARMIGDAFKCGRQAAKDLARVSLAKTGGNPFFLKQFLKAMHDKNIIRFDFVQGSWTWDLPRIRCSDITGNMQDLLLRKLEQLPEDTRHVLKLAACLGGEFDLHTLALLNEKTPARTAAELREALAAGLIAPPEGTHKFSDDPEPFAARYRFLHDQIQQAAYTLGGAVPPGLHLKIGRRLLAMHKDEYDWEEKIFDILHHLNLGAALVTDREEKTELAGLNLFAARKAKFSAAYHADLQYLTAGMGLLAEDRWQTHYELTLALYRERAEAEYVNGNFAAAEELVNTALKQAASPVDSAGLYSVLIAAYCAMTRYQDAIAAGQKALRLLGVPLPAGDACREAVGHKAAAIQELLAGRDISALADLPAPAEPEKAAAAGILASLVPSSFMLNPLLTALIAATMVELALKYGNVPSLAFGYAVHGVFLGRTGDCRTAYEFGAAALKLSESFASKIQKARVSALFGYFLLPWVKPLRQAPDLLTEGYEAGLASGELEYAAYCLAYKTSSLWQQGMNLKELAALLAEYKNIAGRHKNKPAVYHMANLEFVVLDLLGRPGDKLTCANGEIGEEDLLRFYEGNKIEAALAQCYNYRLQARYMRGAYAAALECSMKVEKRVAHLAGFFALALYRFYQSLTLAALYSEASTEEQTLYMERIHHNQAQLRQWADNCPENFLNKLLLVEAEAARLTGDNWQAAMLYDKAIAVAGQNGFIQEEALTNELAAAFWLKKGKEEFARGYLKKAHYGYRLWGAKGKVELLEAQYPRFFTSPQAQSGGTHVISSSSGAALLQTLDLAAILEVAGIIAGEMNLEALLQKIMRIVLENAGAEKGYLILDNEGKMTIKAEGRSNGPSIKVLQAVPVKSARGKARPVLAASVVNLAVRTKTTVVSDDAAAESRFARDPYVADNKLRSVLCLPLVRQGRLVGLLYLENNLVKGAFTPRQIGVLEMLAGQMAISLENAWLYGKLKKVSDELETNNRSLERTVKEQTQKLRAMAKELFTDRERQVLELLVQGHTNKEIGQQLSISPLTVKHHLQNLLYKTGTVSRTALAVKALEFLVPK